MPFAHRWLIALWVFLPAQAPTSQVSTPQPQSQPPPQTPQAPQKPEAAKIDPKDLPVSLDRIQRALAHTPMLRFDQTNKPVFRVQVFGEKPTIEDILGPDFARGPVPYGSMTHQEFLDLVTPKDVQGYAAFSNKEGMAVATTSFLFQWALQKALHKLKTAKDERARAAARQEVMDALDALEKARAKAGMPPK
jgi:hypothetical protein